MSVEEDSELRNLVAQTLENKGILPKIRAELRASVFLALEENISTRETLLKNEELSSFIQIPVGILIINLVREFLEFFGLDFTLSVFDPETKYGKDYIGLTREKLIRDLNISESKKKGPLLYEILSKIVNDFKDDSIVSNKNDKNVITLNLSNNDAVLNGEIDASSPVSNLNATYIKIDGSSTPIAAHSNGDNDQNDSIEEELTSNKSSITDNSLNELDIKKIDQTGTTVNVHQETTNEVKSFYPIPENSNEFDLLTFTPNKDVKKSKERHPKEEVGKKEVDEKSKVNSSSVLGDLPPLNAKTEAKKNKMNEIKAIFDQGLNDNYDDDFHSSISSKSSKKDDGDHSGKFDGLGPDKSQNLDNNSDRSDKTDIVEEENLDEDLSDLINNPDSAENQLTLDETVSKLSDVADHLESL